MISSFCLYTPFDYLIHNQIHMALLKLHGTLKVCQHSSINKIILHYNHVYTTV